jgi:acyl carrier protein
MKDLVTDRIAYILEKHFLITQGGVLASYRRLEALGLNTMEKMELIWYLEQEFELLLSDEEVYGIQTIGELNAAVTRHLVKLHSIAA